jgi:hypothetical protein
MKTIVNFPKITKNGVVQRSLRVMKIKNIRVMTESGVLRV